MYYVVSSLSPMCASMLLMFALLLISLTKILPLFVASAVEEAWMLRPSLGPMIMLPQSRTREFACREGRQSGVWRAPDGAQPLCVLW